MIADAHFIVIFMKRHGMLYEAFLEAQAFHFGPKFITLKIFPLTRFAYANLMVHAVVHNFNMLRDVPVLQEDDLDWLVPQPYIC